jgi:putative ABC transport system permease protein
MRALDRKLLRDVVDMRGQLGAIALIVASAIATYVTMRGAYDSLLAARASYYAINRFPNVFVHLKRAPEPVAARIRELPGVAAVETRVVEEVTLDVPGLAEPATGRIVSLAERPEAMLGLLHLREGRWVERDDDVIVSERFAAANALHPGATLSAVINGRWKRLRVAGVGISPEYVNEVSGSTSFPDNRRWGVLWMSRAAAGPAFSMLGAFNDVAVVLGANAREGDVIAAIDRILEPYGGTGAYGRDEQPSHRFLSDEIKQDKVTSIVLPAIFVIVAAFLIHMVLSRLIAGQRNQIAVLKAFGYDNAALAWHYVGFALIAVVGGSVLGVPLGIWMGTRLTALYRDFFAFPDLGFVAAPGPIATVIAITAASAALGALDAVRRAVAIPPAEGMRGEPPPRYHHTRLDRINALVSPVVRMVARDLERRPLRASMSVAGIAMAVMILVAGRYSLDALDALIAIEFRGAQRDDATLTFALPRPGRALHDVRALPGVTAAEPLRIVPARLVFGHRFRRGAITGVDPAATLRRVTDRDGVHFAVPASGALITRKLAEVLGLRRGDRLHVEILEGERKSVELPVAGVVDELVGLNVYVSLDTIHAMMNEQDAISGASIAVERSLAATLNETLKRTPAVRSVFYREAMLQSFLDTASKSIRVSTGAIIFFACVIAFGVIYNSARIALSERGRDLASLRVLGFSQREVAAMLFVEQGVLTLIGIPIGFAFGALVARLFVALFDTEIYRLPVGISAKSYAFAFLIVAIASVVSALVVRRRIATLDLVEVLKTRE